MGVKTKIKLSYNFFSSFLSNFVDLKYTVLLLKSTEGIVLKNLKKLLINFFFHRPSL